MQLAYLLFGCNVGPFFSCSHMYGAFGFRLDLCLFIPKDLSISNIKRVTVVGLCVCYSLCHRNFSVYAAYSYPRKKVSVYTCFDLPVEIAQVAIEFTHDVSLATTSIYYTFGLSEQNNAYNKCTPNCHDFWLKRWQHLSHLLQPP